MNLINLIEQPPQKIYKSLNQWFVVHAEWKQKGFWARIWAHVTYKLK